MLLPLQGEITNIHLPRAMPQAKCSLGLQPAYLEIAIIIFRLSFVDPSLYLRTKVGAKSVQSR